MRKPLGIGIVGAGFIGRVHAKAARMAGDHLVGIADLSPRLSEALADDLGFARVFARAEDLIADSEVDLVHLCVPNALHGTLVADAISAGKHVICEKPLATSAAEAGILERLADGAGVVAAVPFAYRYYPMVREIRERVRNGDAGRVTMLHGSYLQDWLASETETNWRVDPALGGASRVFADIGVHWADLAEFTSGQRITRLCAQLLTVFPTRPGPGGPTEVRTEDAVTVSFETDGGAIGSVVLSQVALGRKNRLWLSLDGTRASLVFDHEDPDSIWIGGRATNQILFRSPEGLRAPAARYVTLPAGHPQGFQDCFNAFVADCYATVAGEAPDGLPRFADGRRAAEITEAVLASAASKAWEEVPCRAAS
jgi:predicted dehydrogenase